MKVRVFFKFIFYIFPVLLILSCASGKISDFKTQSAEEEKNEHETETLSLCFAGDIMAHKPNFEMKNYGIIWDDVRHIISKADFSFANLETTIDDINPPQTYPKFRVHSSYADEAVKAGFNVFSLANNHINDHELSGINSTQIWAQKIAAKTKNSGRPVYFSGIRSKNEPFSYCIIQKGSWKILFIAATELLNQYTNTSYINFTPPSQKGRQDFIEHLKKLRTENNCDLFILSLHTAETEYSLVTSEKQNNFYLDLLNQAEVDIIWANHPHVVKPWSLVKKSQNPHNNLQESAIKPQKPKMPEKLIMRANGNTISAQRLEPNFSTPDDIHEYTGDSLLLNVILEKTASDTEFSGQKKNYPVRIKSVEPVFITTYIDSEWNFIIKRLNESFIEELKKEGKINWANYLTERKKILTDIKENTIWQ